MNITLLLRGIKKRDWAIGAALAFLLSIAVCVFESKDLPQDGFSVWQSVLCCAVAFGVMACVFALDRLWLPLAVLVGGAVAVGVFARSVTVLFFTVLLPVLLWLWLLRFFASDKKRKNRFGLLCLVLSALLLAAVVFLLARIVSLHVAFDFFRPASNSKLYGFWPLVFLFFVFLFCVFWELRENSRAMAQDGRKKNKQKAKNRPDGFPVWSRYAPPLLFFISAALCYVYSRDTNTQYVPYPLLIDLAALFVLLGTFSFPAGKPESPPPAGQKK